MKKMWKMKKSKEAVSPVIATILMVAITVVLAAVLYVMVMGFGSNPDNNPTASLSKDTTQVAHQEKVMIASISDPQDYSNIKMSLVWNSTSVFTIATGTIVGTPAATGFTVQFFDVANDGKLGNGDYFLITSSGGAYPVTFNLLWGSENANIASMPWTTF
jgi:flagellin-like protein